MAKSSARSRITAAELREKVTLMLVAGMSPDQAEDVAVSKLGATKQAAAKAITDVMKRIALAGHVDLREELGLAISRYRDLFKRAMSGGEYKVALTAQGKLDKLLALHDVPALEPGADDLAAESEADRELAAIAGHVRPHFPEAGDYPLVELVRVLVDVLKRSGVEVSL